ncbi:hypothetical protein [Streptomyces hokutonensis]
MSGTFQVESGRVTIAEPVTHSTARAAAAYQGKRVAAVTARFNNA